MHAVFLIPILITFVLTVEISLLTLNVMMDIFGLNLTFCTVVQCVLCFSFYNFIYYTSLTFICIYIFIHFPLNMFPGLCSLLYFLYLGVDYVFYDLTFFLHWLRISTVCLFYWFPYRFQHDFLIYKILLIKTLTLLQNNTRFIQHCNSIYPPLIYMLLYYIFKFYIKRILKGFVISALYHVHLDLCPYLTLSLLFITSSILYLFIWDNFPSV